MNAIRMMIAIVWLTGLLPGMAQASDADDFVATSRSQQTAMLTRWAATPEPARLPLLKALQQENLYTDSQKKAFTRIDGEMVALGAAKSAEGTTKAVRLTNRLRVLTVTALATHQLVGDSVTEGVMPRGNFSVTPSRICSGFCNSGLIAKRTTSPDSR